MTFYPPADPPLERRSSFITSVGGKNMCIVIETMPSVIPSQQNQPNLSAITTRPSLIMMDLNWLDVCIGASSSILFCQSFGSASSPYLWAEVYDKPCSSTRQPLLLVVSIASPPCLPRYDPAVPPHRVLRARLTGHRHQRHVPARRYPLLPLSVPQYSRMLLAGGFF